MRVIDPVIKSRLLQMQQTLFNNAQPSMEIQALRPRTAIFHPRFWQETIVSSGITATCTSVAVRKTGAIADRVFVAYISGGVLTVKFAALTYPISNMAWTQEVSIPNCSGCALEFDGSFVRMPHGKVEFRTESIPWLFYTTSGNQLMGGLLGGGYDVIAGNVTAFDSIRGVASIYKDIDQGLIVFYIVSGSVYYRQRIAGVWEEQQTVSLAPANAVSIKAERTFDWRIVLQITDNTGALHEVFTKMAISSNINYEQLTVGVETLVDVHEVAYIEARPTHEFLSGAVEMAVATLWGLAPEIVSVANINNGSGNYGVLVRATFDVDLFDVTGNESAFFMVDDEAAGFACTAIEQDGRLIILTFADFNNAVNPISLTYMPGTIRGDVEHLAGFTVSFNTTNLVPTVFPPPLPVIAENPDTLSIVVTFDRVVETVGNAAGFSVDVFEPAWVPGGANVERTYTASAIDWLDGELASHTVTLTAGLLTDMEVA